jgi:ABC-type Mn2+/Zn2+ transport system permease subunit
VDELVQGEITGVGVHEFETLAGVFALVALLFVWFHRDFLLVSYDEETARVLGLPARPAALLLQFVTGATVAVGTMVLGPTLLFGLLVLPPLAARPFARSMTSLYVGATLAGALAVLLGVALAFEFDLPMGAAIVAAAGLVVLPGGVRSLFGRGKDWSASSGT